MTFVYRPEVLEQLVRHGVRPRPHTRPALVSAYLTALYRYELRRLRDALWQHQFPRSAYSERVIALRGAYGLVSVHPSEWTMAGTPGERADMPVC
jgi:hypothetical protein